MNKLLKNKTKKYKSKKNLNKKRRNKSKKNKIMIGGNINPPSFQPFEQQSNQYYYRLNDYNNDPNNNITSSRNLPDMIGGKKMKKTRKNKMRKIKGGTILPDFILGNSQMNNAVTSFANFSLADIAPTILSGNSIDNNSVTYQPAAITYNGRNPPLV